MTGGRTRRAVAMQPEYWKRIQDLFLEAVDLSPRQQAAFLDMACGEDSGLRREVETLLESDRKQSDELEAAVEDLAQSVLAGEPVSGSRLGPWRVGRKLGQGGMGAVYLAKRDDRLFQKQAAIKLVRLGMDTADLLNRFRHKRQILATLEHPYIARLIDGGTAPDGRPYLVMEYVEGQPIDQYCRDLGLNIRQRCELYLKVCEAVSYAHRSLVVHRDLKPGNIFITADGSPKLLDFGVAKLMETDLDSNLTSTMMSGRLLTPEYASPEQVRGLPVTTASDVYSLGAILFEVLTGSKAQRVTSPAPSELERAICDTEVSRPSAITDGNPCFGRSWARQLVGDLDNIVLMAMRKEPERRYSSVDQLAEDVRNYLEGRPVAARKDSVAYRSGKFVRRHRFGLSAAAVVFLSLVLGVVMALSEARKAEAARQNAESQRQAAEREHKLADRERDAAIQERARAEAEALRAKTEQQRAEQRLTEMVALANHSLFDIHSAVERLPGGTEARKQIVQTTLAFLEQLSKDAGNDERLRLALAAAYIRLGDLQGYPYRPSLGDTDGALKSYRSAAAMLGPLRRAHPGQADVLLPWVEAQFSIGTITGVRGDKAAAVKILQDTLPSARVLAGSRPPTLEKLRSEAVLYGELSDVLLNSDSAKALEYARRYQTSLTSLASRYSGDQDVQTELSEAHSKMGLAYTRQGDLRQAAEHFRRSAEIEERVVKASPNDVNFRRDLMLAYSHVGSVLGIPWVLNLGDFDGAREYYRKVAAIARELSDSDAQNRGARFDLASALLRLAAIEGPGLDPAASLETLRKATTILEELSRIDSAARRYKEALGLAYEYAGHRLRVLGQPQAALVQYERSAAVASSILAADAGDLPAKSQWIVATVAIARVLAAEGNREGALTRAREAVARAGASKNASPDRFLVAGHVARAYFGLGDVCAALARREAGPQSQSDWREARAAVESAISAWESRQPDLEKNSYKPMIQQARALLAECNAHLGP